MSDTALVLREEVTEAKIIEYLDSSGITASLLPNEKKMFINIAREFGLNPFKREIHITAYGKGEYRKCSIITGYEVYIKRAERTGKLDGWKCWTEGTEKNLKAIVEIYRKDQKYPFTHEAYYSECCQYTREGKPNAVWSKMPRFMCKKVAIGQAFRLCFPDDLGGMPYEESELENEEPRNVTEQSSPESPPNTTSLAGKAANDNAEEKTKSPAPVGNERDHILAETAKILECIDPDGRPFFTEAEIKQERAIVKGASSIQTLKNQQARLSNALRKRKDAYKPIPFDEAGSTNNPDVPAMFNEAETDEGFQDDIPWDESGKP